MPLPPPKFKFGDRVRFIDSNTNKRLVGHTGVVVGSFSNDGGHGVNVKWDIPLTSEVSGYYEYRFEPDTPISPFESSILEYISKELSP